MTHLPRQTITDGVSCRGHVTATLHAVDDLRTACPEWDSLSKRQQLRVARGVQPVAESDTKNITKDALHTLLGDLLNPDTSDSTTASHLAIGDDGGSGTSATGGLNNELARIPVTDAIDNGKTLTLAGFFDSTEANSGGDIDEGGTVTAASGGSFLNQGTFAALSKSSSNTLTLTVDLSWSDS